MNIKNILRPYWRKIKSILCRLFIEKTYGFGCCKSYIKPLRLVGSKYIFIDSDCYIMPLGRFEALQSYNGKAYNGKLIIQKEVAIGQGAHIVAANELVIEKNATISSYVFISDHHHCYEDISTKILDQPLYIKQVTIGEGCLIGRGVAILAGGSVGKHSVIGANSVVNSHIPDYCVAVGIPAKVIKRFDFERNKWVKVP